MNYNDFHFKIPQESVDYQTHSNFVLQSINSILDKAINEQSNQIVINTNLKFGLPLENINKIAGPIIEAWCYETFLSIKNDSANVYQLINVEAQQRLGISDIVLQFKTQNSHITGNIDVKATAEDIKTSGKSPNITSFSRIRTMYVEDPDFIFVVLSIKHKVYSQFNKETGLTDSVMEIRNYNAYDLKYIADKDITYNPALGTGQIQIKDIHYVDFEKRTAWEFCQLLDKKFLNSSRRTIEDWYREAIKNGWIKND